MRKNLTPLALASFLALPTAHAAVELIAVGTISGTYQDLSTETAAPLENGVAGNRLGGIGSAIAYAGGTTFLMLPDRGPNAVPFNSAIDDTASWIDRFQTFDLALAPSDTGAALPYVLTPTLRATTLLSSSAPLFYGTGVGLGVPSGRPALNFEGHTNFFTGRSDNFDPSRPSTNPNNARLDPEGIRVSNDGESVFITDEYGPYVYQFERATGRRVRSFALPASFAVPNQSPVGNTEISGNTVGRVANKGMEGLAITPDGRTLVGIMQSPLIQDGGTNGATTRVVRIDIASGAVRQYAYPLTNIGSASKPKFPTVSDMVAVNNHEFLVDERDGNGLGDDSTAAFKRLYHIDLNGAVEVSAVTGAADLATKAVAKTLFLDIVAELTAKGYSAKDIPAKLEGVAFGPDIVAGGVTRHTLYVSNDNDFLATVTDSNHPSGLDNSNHMFVFGVDAADLPGLVVQRVAPFDLCGDDRRDDDDHDGHEGHDDHGQGGGYR